MHLWDKTIRKYALNKSDGPAQPRVFRFTYKILEEVFYTPELEKNSVLRCLLSDLGQIDKYISIVFKYKYKILEKTSNTNTNTVK